MEEISRLIRLIHCERDVEAAEQLQKIADRSQDDSLLEALQFNAERHIEELEKEIQFWKKFMVRQHLLLVDAGNKHIQVIKILRTRIPGLGLKETLEAVKATPFVVTKEPLDVETLKLIQTALSEVNANSTLIPKSQRFLHNTYPE